MSLEGAEENGRVRFLRKPFDLSRLVSEVRTALDNDRFAGNVEGITLVELLQVLNMGKRTAALKISRSVASGEIFVTDGEIVHATLGEVEGVAAFNALITWHGGAYSLESGRSPPTPTISSTPAASAILATATRGRASWSGTPAGGASSTCG